jgi:putative sterol carrier protein
MSTSPQKTTAATKMAQAQASIAKNVATASQIGATYKFILEGDGGGTWMVKLHTDPVIHEGDEPADCVIQMDATDYVDMLEGRVEGQQLFFEGKLTIDGDMALAMKLQALNELMAQ